MQELVSVLMPVMRFDRAFDRAFESIVKQTHRPLELIIIDDSRYQMVGQIELLRSQVNEQSGLRLVVVAVSNSLQLGAKLNIGLRHATARYIARMDSDDISNRDRIESQLRTIVRSGSAVCTTSAWVRVDSLPIYLGKIGGYSSEHIKYELLFRNPIIHPSVLLDRRLLGDDIFYNEELGTSQDYALWTALAAKGYKFVHLDRAKLIYTISSGSVSVQRRNEQMRNSAALQYHLAKLLPNSKLMTKKLFRYIGELTAPDRGGATTRELALMRTYCMRRLVYLYEKSLNRDDRFLAKTFYTAIYSISFPRMPLIIPPGTFVISLKLYILILGRRMIRILKKIKYKDLI